MSTSDPTTHAERVADALSAARVSGLILNVEGLVVAATQGARHGVRVAVGASLADAVDPGARAAFVNALHEAASRSGDRPIALRVGEERHRGALRRLAGPERLVLLRLDDAATGLGRLALMTREQDDLAEENRRRRIRLEASQRRFEALFEHAPSGIALLDASLCIRDANPALCALVDATRAELAGRSFADLAVADGQVLDAEALGREDGLVFEQEWRGAADGVLWVHCVATTMPDALGAAPDVLVHVLDVTERRERERRLRYEARHDGLTGLFNLVTFRRELEDALADGGPGWLLGLDIDHFKSVNDKRGHPAGDRVLRGVAGMLSALVPPDATVARVGGDEFAVLVPGTLDVEALAAALLRGAIELDVGRRDDSPVTLSVGAAPLASVSLDEMVELADSALYAAKRGGRNRVARSEPEAAVPAEPVAAVSAEPPVPI